MASLTKERLKCLYCSNMENQIGEVVLLSFNLTRRHLSNM
jgi:hypothetical protein